MIYLLYCFSEMWIGLRENNSTKIVKWYKMVSLRHSLSFSHLYPQTLSTVLAVDIV